MNYFNVAIQAPLRQKLVYQTKDPLVSIGKVVQVPLGSRNVKGLVISKTSKKPEFEVKPILSVDSDILPLDQVRIQWIEWLASYYFHPVGLVAASCYPSKKFKKITNNKPDELPEKKLSLTADQKKCVEGIRKSKGFQVHLLHGVTGSGKTEIYFKLIQEKLKKNQQALVMVPEISLTPQLYSRFSSQFPGQVGLLHSGLKGKKRYQEWQDLVNGNKKILLGARSALFCPLPDLSLIIVDEEHEIHFKQDEKLKYHGRDAAIKLAQMYDIPIVLGSATPDLVTWKRMLEGKYQYHVLEKRFQNRAMPKIQVVDLKIKNLTEDNLFWLSQTLIHSIQEHLKNKKQVALFLNRRGQSSLSLCFNCGEVYKCPNCDVSLTLHSGKYLVCHYCNYFVSSLNLKCSICQTSEVSHQGIGTEGVYLEIQKKFPQAKVRLADSDHVQTPDQFEEIVKDMEAQKIDILIGTQMIAKGLDFVNLSLVGFIWADQTLYGQNFRSSERCFQIITQMSGRAGRHSVNPGQVIVQTYNPDHYIIQYSSGMEFKKMAERELMYRKKMNYPPYCRLATIRVSSLSSSKAKDLSHTIFQHLKKFSDKSLEFLGPAPESVFKLQSRYRYQILIKSASSSALQRVCESIVQFKPLPPQVRVQVNRDP